MRKLVIATITAGAVCLLGGMVQATVWHVPGDAATIQDGIDLAVYGDTVEVDCGTYYEHNIEMKSGVVLKSATGMPDCVTIDGEQMDRVIYCRFISPATRIEGLTITGGYVGFDFGEGNGGGIYCLDNSSPSIVRCDIVGNYAGFDGGGLACLSNSSPSVVDCNITDNEAGNGGSGIRCNLNSHPTFTGCDISDNIGHGLWASNSSSPSFTGCTLSGNSSTALRLQGAGVDASLTDCVLQGNEGGSGGAVFCWSGEVTLTGCTLESNKATSDGGGLYLLDATGFLKQCALNGNRAHAGGGVYLEGSSVLTVDTSFDGNRASSGKEGFADSGSNLTLLCSVDDLGGFDGTGSIVLNNAICPTPVEPMSWGAVKNRYR